MNYPKILYLIGLSLISAFTFTAKASEMQVAKQCLYYGKKVMKDSPDVLYALNQAKVGNEDGDVQLNIYDRKVGRQNISTELVAKIHSNQEKLGTILCLFESDREPLYFHYSPSE
jgi:hypothetical protein